MLDLAFFELYNHFVNNPTFRKSVRLLAHPLSLAALGLMLANDFVFKAFWPSWWTGKLSDFAGLFFLPFLLAALASLCLPGRTRWAAGLGFGLAAAGFSLLKLAPAFNAAFFGAVHAVSGLSLQARPDPSDLLALLSLLPAAWLWSKTPTPNPSLREGRTLLSGFCPALLGKNHDISDSPPFAKQPVRVREGPGVGLRWQLLLLPLAALITLADAAAPDLGLACLQADSGRILAANRYFNQAYQSTDGGVSWQPLEQPLTTICAQQQALPASINDPKDGSTYRFTLSKGIERSADGGATWQLDYALVPPTEPEQAYLRMSRSTNLEFSTLPYAALVDTASGNLILAMGLNGILLRPPAGAWTWVAVGSYQHDTLRQAGAGGVIFLLVYQVVLTLLAGLGWLFTCSARLLGGRTSRVWTILGWIALGVVSLLVSPDIVTSELAVGTFLGLAVMVVATFIALLVTLIRLKGRFFRLLLSSIPQALLLSAVCLLPYVLWAVQVIPTYGLALAVSTGLVIVFLIIFSRGGKEKSLTAN